MSNARPGLGTQLRHLLALLDGDVQHLYDELGVDFRPRFHPVAKRLGGGAASVGEIAAATGVSQPAATQTLNEMQRLGLVAMREGADRRSRLVVLTPEGAALCGDLDRAWRAIDRAAAGLDAELPAGLGPTLGRAIEALRREPFLARIKREMKA